MTEVGELVNYLNCIYSFYDYPSVNRRVTIYHLRISPTFRWNILEFRCRVWYSVKTRLDSGLLINRYNSENLPRYYYDHWMYIQWVLMTLILPIKVALKTFVPSCISDMFMLISFLLTIFVFNTTDLSVIFLQTPFIPYHFLHGKINTN